MANQSKSSNNSQTADANAEIDRVNAASQQSLMAITHLHSKLLANALRVNAELLDFARKRIDQDIRTSDQLSRCSSVTDAVEVMNGFYRDAVADYTEETGTLMRIGQEAAETSVKDVSRETTEMTRQPR